MYVNPCRREVFFKFLIIALFFFLLFFCFFGEIFSAVTEKCINCLIPDDFTNFHTCTNPWRSAFDFVTDEY